MTVLNLDIRVGTTLEYINRRDGHYHSGAHVYEIVSLECPINERGDESSENYLSLIKTVGIFRELGSESLFSYSKNTLPNDFRLVCSAENRKLRKLQNSLYQCISSELLNEFKEMLLDLEL